MRNANTRCLTNYCYLLNVFKCFLDSPAQVNTHIHRPEGFSLCVFSEATEEEAQEMTPVLLNGSPKLPRLPMPSALDHESFDITLHRRDNEGFGFVILTSKSKPPYGSESPRPALFVTCISSALKCAKSAFTKILMCKKKEKNKCVTSQISNLYPRWMPPEMLAVWKFACLA